jgi:integrase/recombinase XerD
MMSALASERSITTSSDASVVELHPQQSQVDVADRRTTIVEADSDERLIDLWLHGRSPGTQRAYSVDALSFLAFASKPLRLVTLNDLQAFQGSLAHLATATQARRLSSIKSLFTFAQKTGYLTVNAGAAIFLPKIRQTLAERILSEDDVMRMLALEPNARNRTLLRLLYLGGLRISEACDLRVRDLAARDDAGQITVFGKGGKTRAILLKASIWRDLAMLRLSDPDAPVFRSRKGARQLDPSQVHRIVKAAAARAGLSDAVSAHWLRHAHVSHALDRGAPAHLVQATVGHASLQTTSRYAHARPTDSSSTYLAG